MASINKVILIGNLGKDPEVRYAQSGDAICNFTIATSEQWKNADGEKQERTEWHRITTFKRLAEICGEYLKKGASVYLEGKLQTRKWQDKEGVDRYTTEIVAHEMKMLGKKGDSQDSDEGDAKEPEQRKAPGPNPGSSEDFSDDIPFVFNDLHGACGDKLTRRLRRSR